MKTNLKLSKKEIEIITQSILSISEIISKNTEVKQKKVLNEKVEITSGTEKSACFFNIRCSRRELKDNISNCMQSIAFRLSEKDMEFIEKKRIELKCTQSELLRNIIDVYKKHENQ